MTRYGTETSWASAHLGYATNAHQCIQYPKKYQNLFFTIVLYKPYADVSMDMLICYQIMG